MKWEMTHFDPLQEKNETVKDVFQQLQPLREGHQSHLISWSEDGHTP